MRALRRRVAALLSVERRATREHQIRAPVVRVEAPVARARLGVRVRMTHEVLGAQNLLAARAHNAARVGRPVPGGHQQAAALAEALENYSTAEGNAIQCSAVQHIALRYSHERTKPLCAVVYVYTIQYSSVLHIHNLQGKRISQH